MPPHTSSRMSRSLLTCVRHEGGWRGSLEGAEKSDIVGGVKVSPMDSISKSPPSVMGREMVYSVRV